MTPDPDIPEAADGEEAGDEALPVASNPNGVVTQRLVSDLYHALRAAARRRLAGERADHTLSATALVHEAFLRIGGPRDAAWRDNAHFHAAAAEAMRRILIDHARAKRREKRGGNRARLSLDSLDLAAQSAPEEILSLDAAIRRLEKEDGGMARVVHLRFFAGLSVEETAAALNLSPATVKRRWTFARAWLRRELSGKGGDAT